MGINSNIRLDEKKGKRALFVDFFDTLMFRHVHPYIVARRWAELLAASTGVETAEYYIRKRKENWGSGGEMNRKIYVQTSGLRMSEEDFVEMSIELECAVEIGVQYVNKRLLKWLRKQKTEGKRLYVVSDFHLGKERIEQFVRAQGVESELIDGIYVSCDMGASKKEGGLYEKVLLSEGLRGKEVLMVGDNRRTDGEMARRYGIEVRIRENMIRKAEYQVRRFVGNDYRRRAFVQIRRDCYKRGGAFSEYALLYATFTERLRKAVEADGSPAVTFLSREGWFLKRLFDDYQGLFVDKEGRVETQYMLCSRRCGQSLREHFEEELEKQRISIKDWLKALGYGGAIIGELAEKYGVEESLLNANKETIGENEEWRRLMSKEDFGEMVRTRLSEIREAGKEYAMQFVRGGRLTLVDIGWVGTMQESIKEVTGAETQGYYLGVNNGRYSKETHHGLLFTHMANGMGNTAYSHVLRANIQLYEELASAPHGSALGYYRGEYGLPKVEQEWAENERRMYEEVIRDRQEEMRLKARGVWAWSEGAEDKRRTRECAKTVLRSALYGDQSRLFFLRKLDEGFFWNATHETCGIEYDPKRVKLRWSMVTHAEEWVRYWAKAQRYIDRKGKVWRVLFKLAVPYIYMYIWLSARMRNR